MTAVDTLDAVPDGRGAGGGRRRRAQIFAPFEPGPVSVFFTGPCGDGQASERARCRTNNQPAGQCGAGRRRGGAGSRGWAARGRAWRSGAGAGQGEAEWCNAGRLRQLLAPYSSASGICPGAPSLVSLNGRINSTHLLKVFVQLVAVHLHQYISLYPLLSLSKYLCLTSLSLFLSLQVGTRAALIQEAAII